MKKRILALVLSFCMAAGGIGIGFPACAAETTAEEAVNAEAEIVEQDEMPEQNKLPEQDELPEQNELPEQYEIPEQAADADAGLSAGEDADITEEETTDPAEEESGNTAEEAREAEDIIEETEALEAETEPVEAETEPVEAETEPIEVENEAGSSISDEIGKAKKIPAGGDFEHVELGGGVTAQYYKFTSETSGNYRISVYFLSACYTEFSAKIVLYNSALEKKDEFVAQYNKDKGVYHEDFTFFAGSGETLYFEATLQEPEAQGLYDICLYRQKRSIEEGYKDAEPIREGEWKDVRISNTQFEQFFKFEAKEDGLYRFYSYGVWNDGNGRVYNSSLQKTGTDLSGFNEYWDTDFYIWFFAKKGEIRYLESYVTDPLGLEEGEPICFSICINRISSGKTARGDMFNLAGNVKVTWKEVPGARYYKVYREGVTNQKESQKDPVIVTTGLIGWDKEPGLTNGHAYRYRIVASMTGKEDSSGDSPLSYSKVMYRLKTVVIRSVKNTIPGAVTLKYDKTTCGDSYVLQYSQNKDMSNAQTRVVKGANTTTYTIGGLKKGKTYYISIRVRKKVNGIDYYTTFGVPKKITINR